MYILGINMSHDRSACLVEDGKIVAAIAEERLDGVKASTLYSEVRKKHLSNRVPPYRSISYCLEAEGIGLDDLALIVANHAYEPLNIESLRETLPIKDKAKIVSMPHPAHHLAHAYSAYFCSAFNESAILVADTFGSMTSNGTEAESGFHADQYQIRPVFKNYQRLWTEAEPQGKTYYSLTYIYNFISLALGFVNPGGDSSSGETYSEAGKTMGLASYGEPGKDWEGIVQFQNGRLDTSRFTQWAVDRKIGSIKNGALAPRVKSKDTRLTQFHKNLAYTAQAEIEKGLLFLAKRLHEITGSKNLCISGGAGLNSITNKKILDETPFENIFIQPAATDDGTAVGCALYGWFTLSKQELRHPIQHIYLGRTYQDAEIRSALKKYSLPDQALTETELVHQTAQHLAGGKIVGWFQGGSEFGPRALGQRSILADPRLAEMKELVNQKVKHREPFRPFAPSVLLEQASEYFDLACPSPYMLLVAKARQEKAGSIPAVVHVDGTARVQTVAKNENRLYYDLIAEFFRLTGVPVVLNTSFNVKGMPIVETPDDALQVFFDSDMDVLVLDRYIFSKEQADTLSSLAAYDLANEKPDKALQLCLEALERFPQDGRFYQHLARCYFEKKNYDLAIQAAEKAFCLAVQPADSPLHYILGMSYELTGQYSEAIPELKIAESSTPGDERINFTLGRCYQKLKQADLMAQELKKGYQKLSDRLKGY